MSVKEKIKNLEFVANLRGNFLQRFLRKYEIILAAYALEIISDLEKENEILRTKGE